MIDRSLSIGWLLAITAGATALRLAHLDIQIFSALSAWRWPCIRSSWTTDRFLRPHGICLALILVVIWYADRWASVRRPGLLTMGLLLHKNPLAENKHFGQSLPVTARPTPQQAEAYALVLERVSASLGAPVYEDRFLAAFRR